MNITLIHNPKAGYQQPSKEELLQALHGKGLEVTYVSSKDSNFIEQVLSSASDLIVVAGGDGTVRKIARLFLGKHVPIALLPTGTANNISKTLHSPLALPQSNESWINLNTRKFDVGMVTFDGQKECFVESAGFGALAELMYRFGKKKEGQPKEFDKPEQKVASAQAFMAEMLQEYQACPYELTIDGQTHQGNYLLVEVMNIRSIGPHLKMAPEANPGDGWFDVVCIREEERENFREYLVKLQQQQPCDAPFKVIRAKSLAIRTTCLKFHIDDELVPAKHMTLKDDRVKLDIHLEKDSLRMFKHTFVLENKPEEAHE